MKLTVIILLVVSIAACSNDTTDSGAPRAVLQPASLEFNTVSIESEKQLTVELENSGDGRLRIDDISIEGMQANSFAVTSAIAFELGPGQSDLIQVRFSPRVEGTHSALLRVTSNAAGSHTVALHGTGRIPGGGNDAVVVNLVSHAPIVDGNGSDAVWNVASSTPLTFRQVFDDNQIDLFSSPSRLPSFTGEMRAVYTTDSIYFRVIYRDESADRQPDDWTMIANDPASQASWRHDAPGQDGFSMIFPVTSIVTGHTTGDTFTGTGCAASCHPTASLESYEGGHFPATGAVDIWYWQAGLTDPLGHADDQVAYGADAGSERSRRWPDSQSPIAEPNFNVAQLSLPPFMAGASNGGIDPTLALWGPEAVAFDPAADNPATGRPWSIGDHVPGWKLYASEQERANVSARGLHAGGMWTIEFARALRTGSDSDIQFDIDRIGYFGVAVHDRQRKFSPAEYLLLPSLPYPSHYGVPLMALIFN